MKYQNRSPRKIYITRQSQSKLKKFVFVKGFETKCFPNQYFNALIFDLLKNL